MERIKIYTEEVKYPITIEVRHSEFSNISTAIALSPDEAKELLGKLHCFICQEKEFKKLENKE